MGQRDEAAALWDRLLAGPEPFPATKVLYARLLAENPATADRARGLTMEILEAASTPSPAVGISVVLAAVENLGKRHLRQWLPDASARFGDLIADSIVTATVRGLEQGFIAFVAVGRYWGFYEPNRFLEVFRQIPPRAVADAASDDERVAWAEILMQASKLVDRAERNGLLHNATEFLDGLRKRSDFAERLRGTALILAERPTDALAVLEPLVAARPDQWNHHRLSQAFLAARRPDDALHQIDLAIAAAGENRRFLATYLAHRADVRVALGDAQADDDLAAAVATCEDAKYANQVREKLVARRQEPAV